MAKNKTVKGDRSYAGGVGNISDHGRKFDGGSGKIEFSPLSAALGKNQYVSTNKKRTGSTASRGFHQTMNDIEQGTRIAGNVLKGVSSIVAASASVIQILKILGVIAQDPEFYSGGTFDQGSMVAQTNVSSDMAGYYNLYGNLGNGTRVASHDIYLTTGDSSAWASVIDTITMQLRVSMRSNLAYDNDDVAAAIWACCNIYLAYKVLERMCRLSITENESQRRINVAVSSLIYAATYSSHDGTSTVSRNFFNDMSENGSAIKHTVGMFREFVKRKILFDNTMFSLIDSAYGALYTDSLSDNPVINVLSYKSMYLLDRNNNKAWTGDAYITATADSVADYVNSLIANWNPIWDVVIADIVRVPGVAPHAIDPALIDLPMPIVFDEGVRLKIRNATTFSMTTETPIKAIPTSGNPTIAPAFLSHEMSGTYVGMRTSGVSMSIFAGYFLAQLASGFYALYGASRWICPGWTNNSMHSGTGREFVKAMNNSQLIATGSFDAEGYIYGPGVHGLSLSDYAWALIDCPKDRRSGNNLVEITRYMNRYVADDTYTGQAAKFTAQGGPEVYRSSKVCVYDQALALVNQPAWSFQSYTQSIQLGTSNQLSAIGNQSYTEASLRTMSVDNECTPMGIRYALTSGTTSAAVTRDPSALTYCIDVDAVGIVSGQTVKSCDEAATIALFTLRG